MNTETKLKIYTQEELLALPPRELDAIVAETVMGYQRMCWEGMIGHYVLLPNPVPEFLDHFTEIARPSAKLTENGLREVPTYSTLMDAAWTVVELMNRNAYFGMACSFPSSEKEHEFLFKKRNVAECDIWASTMPIAICVAAVLAVQGGN